MQTYNMTECLENCALVTGCTWVTVYYDVPYCKIFSTCDGGVNPVTCPNCLSSKLYYTSTDQVMKQRAISEALIAKQPALTGIRMS